MDQSQGNTMLSALSENWWTLALRGLLAVLFGLAVVLWPGPGLLALILLFGAYALVDGALAIVAGIRGTAGPRWLLIVEGVIGVLAGIVAFVSPGITAVALLYLVAFWAIFGGIAEVVAAIALRREIEGEWALILGGLVSVLFGILLLALPGAGLLSLVWLVGLYAVVFGISLLVLAFRVRRGGERREPSRVT